MLPVEFACLIFFSQMNTNVATHGKYIQNQSVALHYISMTLFRVPRELS